MWRRVPRAIRTSATFSSFRSARSASISSGRIVPTMKATSGILKNGGDCRSLRACSMRWSRATPRIEHSQRCAAATSRPLRSSRECRWPCAERVPRVLSHISQDMRVFTQAGRSRATFPTRPARKFSPPLRSHCDAARGSRASTTKRSRGPTRSATRGDDSPPPRSRPRDS